MTPVTEVIRRKRDGHALSEPLVFDFIGQVTSGRASDAQIAAFAMAVVLNGMSADETVALTRAMTASGDQLDWSNLPAPVLDKHSTGGIGDKVSLVLAPMLAAVGVYVPMISGRGLAHTGGTLDKLEAIPGYNTDPDIERFQAVVADAGCAIVGANARLAPADKRCYGVRDVTATVESTALITASILSKKLAAGIAGLVMDVKTGSGAFASELTASRELAGSLVEVAKGQACPLERLSLI